MLNDLLMLVGSLLGLGDVTDYLASYDADNPTTPPSNLTDLKRLANFAYSQIVRDYMPLLITETKTSNASCEIAYAGFSKTVANIKKVCFENGTPCTFRCFPEFIKVGYPTRKFLITYAYVPNEFSDLEDEIELPFGLSLTAVAFATCFEYAIAGGLYDEADMWEQRFKEKISSAIRGNREHKLPSRGWI
ncbi:MAG: hypothetical protein IJS68_03355 [Clostridia bacterium]|nr:hypothetical protein [Clostridia bacterium]